MNRLAMVATLAFVMAPAGAFAAEGTFEKTFSVSVSPTVSVSTGSGYIHVFPGSDSQVHVVGHVHANKGWMGGDADARVRKIVADPPISQSGANVTIGGNHDKDLFQNVSIDYDVTTPRQTILKANTGSGELRVGGIEGAVTGGSGSGNVVVENIGANAVLESGSGSIHAANVHGAANLETGSGDLDLDLAAPGDVKARTGSGSIRVHGLTGGLHADAGSGSIEIAGTPTTEWRIQTGSGDVRMKMQGGAKFTLNANTGSGSIHVDQPIMMQGSTDRHHFSGAVNGGGPEIRASTGSGDISIH